MKRVKLGLVVMVALAVTLASSATAAHAQAAWTVVASPSPSAGDNELLAVVSVAAADVWAVGRADNSNTPSQHEPLIEHWNGTAWRVVPGPTTGIGELWGVAAVASTDVWAVGDAVPTNGPKGSGPQALIAHWDGRAWTVAKAPSVVGSALHAVAAVAANDVWAVGTSGAQTCIEHWNGKRWSVVASPSPGAQSSFLDGVTAVGPNDVWAVGSFMTAGYYLTPSTPEQTLVLHWDGTQWRVVPSPSPSVSADGAGDAFQAVAAVSSTGAVWAVGETQDPASGVAQTLVEQWNGSSWSVVPSPSPGAGSPARGMLRGASADPASGQAWAVGVFTPGSGAEQTLTEVSP